MAVRFSPDVLLPPIARVAMAVCILLGVAGCERAFTPTPPERVGYLRELIRARRVSRDTLPIDACSVSHFMDGVPAWRDSLVASERSMIIDATPCPDSIQPVRGRFVLTSWYRAWSGEYVIRGATFPWDQGYRFTDGVFVGREMNQDQAAFAGIGEPRPSRSESTARPTVWRGDSIRRAGSISDTAPASAARDTLRR